MLTAARAQQVSAIKAAQDTMPFAAIGVAALVQTPFAARRDHDDAAPDVPLTAVQAAHAAIPKGPAPAHVPLAGYEPEDKNAPAEPEPAPDATSWLDALRVIRSA